MKDRKVKCVITRYDNKITKPPFKTIKIGETEVQEPIDRNDGGLLFFKRLQNACYVLGYRFKFYTLTKEKSFVYEIVVE